MSIRITSLSLITGPTNTQSSYVWTVWNGKDYKVSFNDLGKFVGRSAGFMTAPYTTPYAVAATTIITWGATPTLDDIGVWYNTGANSHIQRAQFLDDRISEVNMSYQINAFGTGQLQFAIYKNGNLLVSSSTIGDSRIEGKNTGGYPVAFQGHAHRISVVSGDYFDIRCEALESSPRTIEIATNRCFWQIQPVVYR